MKIILLVLLLIQIVTACSGGVISNFFQRRIQKAVKLTNGGFVFRLWRDADVPIYMIVRFFNVTNPNRVLKGDKPIFREAGPYVYQETRENKVEEFSEDDETVFYRMKTTFQFRPEYSYGSEDDVITTLNAPYVVAQQRVLNLSSLEKSIVREIFSDNNERLFMKKTVRELMFDGYHQNSIAQLSEFRGEELLPNNTFGYFYGKNDTFAELLEIYTGVGNETRFGQTKSFEGQTELPYWDSEKCNKVTGSDGAVFTPWLTRNTTLTIFSPDLCRTMYLNFEKRVRVTGIPGYRFVVPREVLASPEENPENECFCKNGEYGPCLKTGAMRLAPCRGGTPVVISWPHFYNGDEEYLNQSVGMKPDKDLHETFVILEPYTGYIRRGSKRFQINFELIPNRSFRDMKRIPKMIFPVLWVEESKLSRFRTQTHFNNLRNSAITGNKIADLELQSAEEDESDDDNE